MRNKEKAVNHSEECRDRFAQIFMAKGDTRVLRDIDRVIEEQQFARQNAPPEVLPVVRDEEINCEDEEMEGIQEEH